jgi:hypothetical protein
MTDQTSDQLVFHSHYQAAIAAKQLLQEGKVTEVEEILEELIAAMGRSEKRAVKSQLTRLMKHIIKWTYQPEKRSSSWIITIRSARREIIASQEEIPSLNQDFLRSIWQPCFNDARQDAIDEMGTAPAIAELTWEAVFAQEYTLATSNY